MYLSINIQSLMSKHSNLVSEIADMQQHNLSIDAIAIQEIWDLRYPELVPISGFQEILYKKRRNMRGGGIGFYIRNGISA